MAWVPSSAADERKAASVKAKSTSPTSENGSPSQVSAATSATATNSTASTCGRNPPALVRLSTSASVNATQNYLLTKSESMSDGDLSDFSLNDTEEEEEEFRNCVLHNGSQGDGSRPHSTSPRNMNVLQPASRHSNSPPNSNNILKNEQTSGGINGTSVGGTSAGGGVVRKVFTNTRERWRQQNVSGAFAELRKLVPTHPPDKKLSKNEILRMAIKYIKLLTGVLEWQKQQEQLQLQQSQAAELNNNDKHMRNGHAETPSPGTSAPTGKNNLTAFKPFQLKCERSNGQHATTATRSNNNLLMIAPNALAAHPIKLERLDATELVLASATASIPFVGTLTHTSVTPTTLAHAVPLLNGRALERIAAGSGAHASSTTNKRKSTNKSTNESVTECNSKRRKDGGSAA